MRHKIIFTLILLTLNAVITNASIKDIATIKGRYVNLLLPDKMDPKCSKLISQLPTEKNISDQIIRELFSYQPFNENEIQQLTSKIDKDGIFNDIDYHNSNKSRWEPSVHVDRLLQLCKYSKSINHKNKQLCTNIHKLFQTWIKLDLTCPNWWYNEIGVPMAFGRAALCFEEMLSSEEKAGINNILDHCKFGRTGQNRVWQAGNVLLKALLNNDIKLAKDAQKEIADELIAGNLQGVQPDGSFRQHGKQQQWGNYGLAYLSSMALYINMFNGTFLDISADKKDIIYKLFFEGYRYIIYGHRLDVNAMDRQIFPNTSRQKALSILQVALNLYNACPKHMKKDMQQFIKEQLNEGSKTDFTETKYYPYVNQFIHRQENWMASIKMCCDSIIGTENTNKDNMKGFYTADGATMVYVDGDEYDNIFPLWDYRKIPGITCYNTSLPLPRADEAYGKKRLKNKSSKVNGISKDGYGIAMMEVKRDGIHAKKAWITTPQFMIAVGTDIYADSTLSLTTTMEQKQPKGAITIMSKGRKQTAEQQHIWQNDFPRIYCDKIGYIPLTGDTLILKQQNITGNWHDCIDDYPSEEISGKVMSLYFGHNKNSKNSQYAYIILPNTSIEEMSSFNVNEVKIQENSKSRQVIQYKDKIFTIDWINNKLEINTDTLFN